jgi:hypothetical protein
MATLRQLKAAKPKDYIESYWPEMKNGYYKVYKNSGKELVLSYMFFRGSVPEGKKTFDIKDFYDMIGKFKIIPGNSTKTQSIEGKLAA